MPIYKANGEFVERVYKGKEPILRIYKPNKDGKIKEENFVVDEIEEDILLDDNSSLLYSVVKGTDRELVYGLFNIDYNKGLQDQQLIGDVEDKYAGGKKRTLPTLPSDPTEYTYLTHGFNWYDDYALEQLRKNGISKDDQKDLSLFAKWKQKKFSYSGQGQYTGEEKKDGRGPDGAADVGIPYKGYSKSQLVSATGGSFRGEASNGCAEYVWGSLLECGYDTSYGSYMGSEKYFARVFRNAVADGQMSGRNFSFGDEPVQENDIITFATGTASTNAAHVGIATSSSKCINGNISSQVYEGGIQQLADYNGGSVITVTRLSEGSSWTTRTAAGTVAATECDSQKQPTFPDVSKYRPSVPSESRNVNGKGTSKTYITQERLLNYSSTGTSGGGSGTTTKESSDSGDKDGTGD